MPYTSNPSSNGNDWFVWDVRAGIDQDGVPLKVLYVGTMEECGGVADQLNLAALDKDRAAGQGR